MPRAPRVQLEILAWLVKWDSKEIRVLEELKETRVTKELLVKGVPLVNRENLAMTEKLEKLDCLVIRERPANQALKGKEGQKVPLENREARVQEVRQGFRELWVLLALRVIVASRAS